MLNISPNFTTLKSSTVKSPLSKFISFKGNIQQNTQDAFVKSQVNNGEKTVSQCIQELEEQGYRAFRQGDFEQCAENLKKAVILNPNSAQSWHALGSAQRELGEYEEAIESYTQAFNLRPDSANSVGLRGLAKAKYAQELKESDPIRSKSLYLEAVKDYDTSLDLRENAEFYDYKVSALMATSSYKQAIETLEESISFLEEELIKQPNSSKIKAKLAQAHHRKGICLYITASSPRSGINNKAYDEFTKALEYAPNSANTYYERAKVGRRINFDNAKQDALKAIELAPNRARYYELLGNMLIMSDDEDERQDGFNYLATGIFLNSGK